jgi:DNA-binding NarL/FixJ family response regulator
VLIVDDHPYFRRGLSAFVSSNPGLKLIGEAADGVEALELVAEKAPDLIILDLDLPKVSGWDVLKSVRRRGLRIRILIVSNCFDRENVLKARDEGADGYAFKIDGDALMLQAIQEVLGGAEFSAPALAPGSLPSSETRAKNKETEPHLTPREREIMEHVAKATPPFEIAKLLGTSPRTVQSQLSQLRRKFGAPDYPSLVLRAHKLFGR